MSSDWLKEKLEKFNPVGASKQVIRTGFTSFYRFVQQLCVVMEVTWVAEKYPAGYPAALVVEMAG